MKAMNIVTATNSGIFNTRSCSCGRCAGQEHLTLVSRNALLLDVHDREVQAFCSTTATYVKVVITYHCNRRSRTVSASWEVRNPSGDLVLRSEAKTVSDVFVPLSEAGDKRLLGLLRVKATLVEAARRKRAA